MNKWCMYVALALLLGQSSAAEAQQRSRGKALSGKKRFMQENPFFHQQWWVGMKGGLSVARAVPQESYSVFQPVGNVAASAFEKSYLSYELERPATTIGLIGSFSFWRNFSISLQPTHTNLRFAYETSYLWEGEGTHAVALKQTHRLALSYLNVPLMLRYDIFKARIRPYVQGGAYYGRLLKADKSMEVESFDAASGAQNPIANTTPIIGAGDMFISSNIGWLAGAGISYDLGSMRLGLEVNYQQGLSNVTDRQQRFADQRMLGQGDVLDDMRLQNWEAAFTLLFPLKFLDTGSFVPAKP